MEHIAQRIPPMAGRVRATAFYSQSADGIEIMPDNCPVADSHRKAAEREHAGDVKRHWPGALREQWSTLKCTSLTRDGVRHHCPYLYATVEGNDPTMRLDMSLIRIRTMERATLQTPVSIMCTGANRNVPPGC